MYNSAFAIMQNLMLTRNSTGCWSACKAAHLVQFRDVIDQNSLGLHTSANLAVQVGNAHLHSMCVVPPKLLHCKANIRAVC